ncbi:MAG TPA: thiamine pyrophosphate-dependent enzyme, partial [Solirubrobacteraceae bacterium]|nr:thiamine pyrophosphate-dependent enzyme [Solirubrobacteraceae bacterium]
MTDQAPDEEAIDAVEAPQPQYGSDMIATLLERLGIEYLSMSPGATFRGLHDSLVNFGGPEIIESLHEEISVAIAHGYAKAAGRPLAVALHDVVGLQHATMAIFNAWCDRVPVLLLGATGPMDATKRRPWIDWIHTANVQGQQVRDYVKWDDQPGSLEAIPESLLQGLKLATTEPTGPVYICMDVDHQEQTLPADFELPELERFAAYGRSAAEPEAIDTLARWLLGAERPVIVADLVGRSEAGFDALVELAELLGAPVIDPEGEYWKNALNFPTRHPLNLSGAPELIGDADVVLGLEVRDLFGVLNSVDVHAGKSVRLTPSDARVAHISVAHLLTRSWAQDFQRLQPVDLHIAAELELALPQLLGRVRELVGEHGDVAAIDQRRARLSAQSAALFAGWDAIASEVPEPGPLPVSYVAHVVDQLTSGHDRVLANGHLRNWAHRLWSIDRPDQYLGGQGGAGLGYGLGASIGAALAHRDSDRLVIDLQSDGDALFTPSALWTAAHYELPLLIVVDDNRAYNNSVKHADRVAVARGRSRENIVIGTTIDDPPIDFSLLAKSYGVHSE